MLAGWASGSKYPLLGSVRASAQLVSYEAVLGLTTATVVLVTGSLRTSAIVASQHGGFLNHWNFLRTLLIPFVLFSIAITAEMTRPPFDLVEAEEELSGGYNLEYSSIDFAWFYLAEYAALVTNSAIIVTLWFGGPDGPRIAGHSIGPVWFMIKVLIILFIYVWIRATLPRLRYDQLMDLGWKRLIPASLAMLMIVAGCQISYGLGSGRLRRQLCCSGRGACCGPSTSAGRATSVEAARHDRLTREGGPVSFLDFFKGFVVTGKLPFKPKVTVQYPEEKRPKPERFHGRHVLNRYEDGMEKCIGCELCAGVCPARCIYVRGADNPPDAPGVARRALRVRLRDQLPALHPLRHVRGGLPDRGHHRVEAVRVVVRQPRGRHLHQGRAARRRRGPPAGAALGGLEAGRRPQHLGVGAGHQPGRGGRHGRPAAVVRRARLRRAAGPEGPERSALRPTSRPTPTSLCGR